MCVCVCVCTCVFFGGEVEGVGVVESCNLGILTVPKNVLMPQYQALFNVDKV